MRRKFGYILLSFLLLAGTGNAFADKNDHRGGKDRQEQRNTRPGNRGNGNSNRGNGNKNHGNGNNGWNNGNKHNDNKKHNDKHKDHGNKHNDKFLGRPGGNNGHGNMNQGRPGGNVGHHPAPAPAPAPRPGYGHPAPAPHHPAPAPVVRPGAGGGFHYGPALPPPPPRLPYMVDYATRGCRDVSVWQVDNETFIVKYWRAGRWYTQYIYPYIQQYSTPTLISVNWQPMSPWTLIPPIQLNINL